MWTFGPIGRPADGRGLSAVVRLWPQPPQRWRRAGYQIEIGGSHCRRNAFSLQSGQLQVRNADYPAVAHHPNCSSTAAFVAAEAVHHVEVLHLITGLVGQHHGSSWLGDSMEEMAILGRS